MRRPLLLTLAALATLAAVPEAFASADARVTSLELAQTGERTFELEGDDTVHPRRRSLARFGTRALSDAVDGRPVEHMACAAPEAEDGPDERSAGTESRGDGGSATRGGSGMRLASRCGPRGR